MKTSVYTIGHSTHSIDEFINILKHYDIQRVVDIRTFLNLDIILNLMRMILKKAYITITLAIYMSRVLEACDILQKNL